MICPLNGGIIINSPSPKCDSKKTNDSKDSISVVNDSAKLNGYDVKSLYFPNKLKPSILSLEERYANCLSIAEECIVPEELKKLLESKANPLCYDGFEPSGRMHIAQGISKVTYVNRLTEAGCLFVFWIADWFAALNNKLGGDLKKCVGEYFIEIWKQLGMNMENVRFLWASEEINKHSNDYWSLVMDISSKNTISRVKRCSQIMGRQEGDDQPCSSILYPCMQAADIFYLKADICQLGMDQRKVNMLAREYSQEKKMKFKPVILSHKMLSGLLGNDTKMSKSDPNSAIFMDDPEEIVNRKIKTAYCPPCDVNNNPCIEYAEYVILPSQRSFLIERKDVNGGNIIYSDIKELKKDYADGSLHPLDLKIGLSKALNKILEPLRQHFKVSSDQYINVNTPAICQNNPQANALYQRVKQYTKK